MKLYSQEAEFYGAASLVFKKNKRPCVFKATWMHGMAPTFRDNPHSDVLLHYDEKDLPLHLVNNQKTVNMLSNEGITSIAVGMPYIYTDAFSNKKRDNVIHRRMYMPPHSIAGVGQADEYYSWKRILEKYNCDSICLASKDYENVASQEIDFGEVKILKGAHAADETSLARISEMFFSTDEMLTNVSGSHLPYAAASGVRVKIIDEIHEFYDSRMRNNYASKIVNSAPKKNRKSFTKHLQNNRANEIVEVWGKPGMTVIQEYSEYLLGIVHKRKADEIMRYLTPNNELQKLNLGSRIFFNKLGRRLGL
jgi:hypothetical protein